MRMYMKIRWTLKALMMFSMVGALSDMGNVRLDAVKAYCSTTVCYESGDIGGCVELCTADMLANMKKIAVSSVFRPEALGRRDIK